MTEPEPDSRKRSAAGLKKAPSRKVTIGGEVASNKLSFKLHNSPTDLWFTLNERSHDNNMNPTPFSSPDDPQNHQSLHHQVNTIGQDMATLTKRDLASLDIEFWQLAIEGALKPNKCDFIPKKPSKEEYKTIMKFIKLTCRLSLTNPDIFPGLLSQADGWAIVDKSVQTTLYVAAQYTLGSNWEALIRADLSNLQNATQDVEMQEADRQAQEAHQQRRAKKKSKNPNIIRSKATPLKHQSYFKVTTEIQGPTSESTAKEHPNKVVQGLLNVLLWALEDSDPKARLCVLDDSTTKPSTPPIKFTKNSGSANDWTNWGIRQAKFYMPGLWISNWVSSANTITFRVRIQHDAPANSIAHDLMVESSGTPYELSVHKSNVNCAVPSISGWLFGSITKSTDLDTFDKATRSVVPPKFENLQFDIVKKRVPLLPDQIARDKRRRDACAASGNRFVPTPQATAISFEVDPRCMEYAHDLFGRHIFPTHRTEGHPLHRNLDYIRTPEGSRALSSTKRYLLDKATQQLTIEKQASFIERENFITDLDAVHEGSKLSLRQIIQHIANPVGPHRYNRLFKAVDTSVTDSSTTIFTVKDADRDTADMLLLGLPFLATRFTRDSQCLPLWFHEDAIKAFDTDFALAENKFLIPTEVEITIQAQQEPEHPTPIDVDQEDLTDEEDDPDPWKILPDSKILRDNMDFFYENVECLVRGKDLKPTSAEWKTVCGSAVSVRSFRTFASSFRDLADMNWSAIDIHSATSTKPPPHPSATQTTQTPAKKPPPAQSPPTTNQPPPQESPPPSTPKNATLEEPHPSPPKPPPEPPADPPTLAHQPAPGETPKDNSQGDPRMVPPPKQPPANPVTPGNPAPPDPATHDFSLSNWNTPETLAALDQVELDWQLHHHKADDELNNIEISLIRHIVKEQYYTSGGRWESVLQMLHQPPQQALLQKQHKENQPWLQAIFPTLKGAARNKALLAWYHHWSKEHKQPTKTTVPNWFKKAVNKKLEEHKTAPCPALSAHFAIQELTPTALKTIGS